MITSFPPMGIPLTRTTVFSGSVGIGLRKGIKYMVYFVGCDPDSRIGTMIPVKKAGAPRACRSQARVVFGLARRSPIFVSEFARN